MVQEPRAAQTANEHAKDGRDGRWLRKNIAREGGARQRILAKIKRLSRVKQRRSRPGEKSQKKSFASSDSPAGRDVPRKSIARGPVFILHPASLTAGCFTGLVLDEDVAEAAGKAQVAGENEPRWELKLRHYAQDSD